MSDAWVIGWAIGAVVVVLVVALLLALIVSARRIGDQAAQIRRSLETLKDNTEPLWRVANVNVALRSIAGRLAAARHRPPSEAAQEDRW